ncbi:ASCH domain-containing protein [Microbacterium sp. No. 7]|uniref:ASCH domain-containing protein n=1 Tax=Microbacterium sp. No. 7 TaxID=1714373 RepID=UPI003009B026
MTRAVLLSVKPRFARAILEGRKTVEVRRRFPQIPTGTTVVLYSSSPERAVLGTVRLKRAIRVDPNAVWETYSADIGIEEDALEDYLAGADSSTVLQVEAPESWSRPVSLGLLREIFGLEPPQSFRYLTEDQVEAIRFRANRAEVFGVCVNGLGPNGAHARPRDGRPIELQAGASRDARGAAETAPGVSLAGNAASVMRGRMAR